MNMTDQQFENIYGYPRNPPPPKPFVNFKQPYNSKELATYAQARELVESINSRSFTFVDGSRPMGKGVPAGDDSEKTAQDDTSGLGIFQLQAAFVVVPSEDDPVTGEKYFTLMIRFNNGCTMNVGLILDAFSRNRYNQSYVLFHLINDVELNAKG